MSNLPHIEQTILGTDVLANVCGSDLVNDISNKHLLRPILDKYDHTFDDQNIYTL